MTDSFDRLLSLRFAISTQGGVAHCAACTRELARGECVVFVALNEHRYFFLGLPEQERPTCCGERRNVIAVFPDLETACARVRAYQEAFLASSDEEELLAKVPLKPIPLERVPSVVIAGWRSGEGERLATPLH